LCPCGALYPAPLARPFFKGLLSWWENPKSQTQSPVTPNPCCFLKLAALLIFMRRTDPFEPVEPTEPAEPLSHKIKGRYVPRATSEPNEMALPFHFSILLK